MFVVLKISAVIKVHGLVCLTRYHELYRLDSAVDGVGKLFSSSPLTFPSTKSARSMSGGVWARLPPEGGENRRDP